MGMRPVFMVMALLIISTWGKSQYIEQWGDTVKVMTNKKIQFDSAQSFVRINKIYITGNKRTRKNIILRELVLKEGNVISRSALSYVIKKDQQKLFNLHLFNAASIRTVDAGPNLIDLHLELDERWYSFPIPRFQLSDRNFNEWWQNYNHDLHRVNYGFKLYQYNLWGLNHTLLLKTQFGFRRDFQLTYKIPYITTRQKEGLILEMDYIDGKSVPDSTIGHKFRFVKSGNVIRTTKSIGVTYTYRKNFYLQHRIKYEYRLSSIADTLAILNPNYFGEEQTRQQQYDGVTYEVTTDRSDVTAYPLKGYAFTASIQQCGIAINHDLKKTSAYLRFSGYLDLGKKFYLSNLSYIFLSTPNRNLPYYNYSTMGYDKIFVRGYEIYVIEGPNYFLNKTTLKKKLIARSWHLNNWSMKQFNYLPIAVYVKTYADFGYVDNYEAYEWAGVNSLLTNKLLKGAGFGLDVVTGYDLAIRLEYTFTPLAHGFFLHFKKEF